MVSHGIITVVVIMDMVAVVVDLNLSNSSAVDNEPRTGSVGSPSARPCHIFC